MKDGNLDEKALAAYVRDQVGNDRAEGALDLHRIEGNGRGIPHGLAPAAEFTHDRRQGDLPSVGNHLLCEAMQRCFQTGSAGAITMVGKVMGCPFALLRYQRGAAARA